MLLGSGYLMVEKESGHVNDFKLSNLLNCHATCSHQNHSKDTYDLIPRDLILFIITEFALRQEKV